MYLASDNSGPVHPKIMEALARANEGYAFGYGNDPLTTRAADAVREVFEAPDASVHFVATGTAANSLILASMARPWDAILCAEQAHVEVDECNAPEFFTGGAKLRTIPAEHGRIAPDDLRRALSRTGGGVHHPQTGPVTLTSVTEDGAVYGLDQLAALSGIAHGQGAKVHLDGARFANAAAALGCSAAQMSWKAGIDAVSFGGTKNGCMGVEACVIFDPALGHELELRRKRAGHLFSKHRYLAAQMAAYLEDGLWLDLARAANDAAAELAEGLIRRNDVEILHPVEANMIFARFPRALHQRLRAGGAAYYVMDGNADEGPGEEPLLARFVCDWSLGSAGIRAFLDLV